MSTASFRRNPLIIAGNQLSSGDRSATFAVERPDSLLRSYLILVRDLRGQRREPSIELRTEDVRVIAAHLGVSDQLVLGGLLDLMGATRAQRHAMTAMLAAGALTLVLTGSLVTDLSTDGVSVEMGRLAQVVQTTVQREADTAGPRAAAETPGEPTIVGDDGGSPAGASTRDPADVVAAPDGTGAARVTAGPVVGAAPESSHAQVAGEPVSIAVAPDGSLVASVAPPVPAPPTEPQTATAQLPDGTTVGVATPPIPPSTVPAPPAPPTEPQTATTELPDGTTVGVATPPIPPPTDG